MNLSGGQKARVSLARALYACPDIALLDDPLSAVDPAVADHIFQEAVCAMLRDRVGSSVILVTHHTQVMPFADVVVVMGEGGRVLAQGSFQEVQALGLISDSTVSASSAQNGHKADLVSTSGASAVLCGVDDASAKNPEGATAGTGAGPGEGEGEQEGGVKKEVKKLVQAEDRTMGVVRCSTWMAYVKASGRFLVTGVLILFLTGASISNVHIYVHPYLRPSQTVSRSSALLPCRLTALPPRLLAALSPSTPAHVSTNHHVTMRSQASC